MAENLEEKEERFVGEPHQHSQIRRAQHVPDGALEKAARLFKALADFERLKLLTVLSQGEACVSELATSEQMSTVSQRLKVLYNENLVTKRRDGKHIIYGLADHHVYKLVENALSHVQEPGAS